MGYRELFAVLLVFGCANAQINRVCVFPSEINQRCQNMNLDGSLVSCTRVESRVECADKMARNEVDVGLFSEEEVLLLSQMPSNSNLRVLASVRDARREEDFAFETVVVVPSNHTNGFEGLRGGRYCHPGLGASDIRWSPRVLKALEVAAARTDRCEGETGGKTAEELEVEALNGFFSAACRPGPWSYNSTVDTELKNRFPSLCSMCTAPGVCAGYSMDQAISVAGVQNSNRHIQALECLRTNGSVAYVAWQHVREFFSIRNPDVASNYALLCENGTLATLTTEALNSLTSPCALVRQPWSAIVATANVAEALLANLRSWWPQNADPGTNSWHSALFAVLAGDNNARVFYETTPITPSEYTSRFRNISSIDSVSSCLPARRWCTTSAQEQQKCLWVRAAAYSLGIQPAISCQQRTTVFECLSDVAESRVDFFSLDSHYGYLARRHYKLAAVKLVQNLRGYTSRVAALVKESRIANISRLGNLKDGVACFPEYGGLAFVAFIRAAQDLSVISSTECNYSQAASEFFSSACAPGALSSSHSISDGQVTGPENLCSACQPAVTTANSNFTCAYNWTNAFFGNNGTLNCLAAPQTDIAFIELQNINTYLQELRLNASSFRVLCQNDSLAANPGVDGIDDACLLTHVVDAEVISRRDDPTWNSINTLLDGLDQYFGYNINQIDQLINLYLFSAFDGVSDLLFKDSTIGLTEPSKESTFQPARNYIDLFAHLESCTSSAPPTVIPGGYASRSLVSVMTLVVMGLLAKFVVY